MVASFCNSKKESQAILLGITTQAHQGGLITNNTNLITANTSLISNILSEGGMDTCSFYSGPSEAAIVAFGESCDSIAYGDESCGSMAYSGGGESCGSIATSVGSCSGGTSTCCSYSC